MHEKFVQQSLHEAAEHLTAAIEAARMGDAARFETWLPWVYRKLNAAWNSRNLTEQEAMNINTYEARCRLPADMDEFFET